MNLFAPTVNRPLRVLVITATLALPTACAVGPDYSKPATVEPATFKYDSGWKPMPPQGWQASGQWWQVFGNDQLDDLIERANSNNQTLAQAQARYRTALAQRRGSRSEFSPTLSAAVDGSRAGGSDVSISESTSARLGIGWEADLWGRIRRQVEADTASVEASAADVAAARLSIQLAVTNSYINVLTLDRQKQILEQTLEAFERSAQLTRNQYDAGIVARADVIQAETQLQSLRSDLYDLQNQRAIEENTIAALLGVAPSAFALAPAGELPEIPAIPAQLPGELIARRPDVVTAERGVAAANASIGVAVAAWLPDLSISAARGVSGVSFNDLWNAPVHFWSVGPTLAQTLFDGGRRRADRDAAVARYDEQVSLYRQTVLDSLRDVENALATTSILAEKAVQQEKLVALAEENERLITNRYKSGLVSFLEVATAQNTTLNARRGLVNVNASRLAATADLAAAVGGGWEVGRPIASESSDS